MVFPTCAVGAEHACHSAVAEHDDVLVSRRIVSVRRSAEQRADTEHVKQSPASTRSPESAPDRRSDEVGHRRTRRRPSSKLASCRGSRGSPPPRPALHVRSATDSAPQSRDHASASRREDRAAARVLTTLKIAVFAPIPSASVVSATRANPGARRSDRQLCSDVLAQLGDEIGAMFLACAHGVLRQTVSFRVIEIAEFAHGLATRVGLGQALLHELARAHVEVETELVIEVRAPARR